MLISIFFALIYAFYTIPTEIKEGAIAYPDYENRYPDWIREKSWEDMAMRVWTAFIAYTIITAIAVVLLVFTAKAWQYVSGDRKDTLQYFGLALLFYALGTGAMSIGTGMLIYLKSSYVLGVWYGIVYPISLPVAMMYAGIAPYFMLKFSHRVAKGEDPSKIREIGVLVPMGLLFLFMTSHYNWFGVYAPSPETFDIRFISNTLLLLTNLIAVIQIIVFLKIRASQIVDQVKKLRLKTLMWGFIMMLGFFIAYALDAITKRPLTIWMFIAYPFALIGIILMYLGTLSPEWYLRLLQRSK